jgi:hypothetical protein
VVARIFTMRDMAAAGMRSASLARRRTVLIGLAAGLVLLAACRPSHRALPPKTEVVPRPGQTIVTGTVTLARFDSAEVLPLRLPLVIDVAHRGVGGGNLSNAVVGGRVAAVAWDGGTPLTLKGTGTLDLSPAAVEVSGQGLRWSLDGHPNVFGLGHFSIAGPVAVGAKGLATPRDGLAFTANASPQTVLLTNGGVTTLVPLTGPVELHGPGQAELEGRLTSRTTAGARTATRLLFPAGPFEVTLTASAGGVTINALFQPG